MTLVDSAEVTAERVAAAFAPPPRCFQQGRVIHYVTGDPAAFVHTARPIDGVEQAFRCRAPICDSGVANSLRVTALVQQPALPQVRGRIQIVQIEHRLRLRDHAGCGSGSGSGSGVDGSGMKIGSGSRHRLRTGSGARLRTRITGVTAPRRSGTGRVLRLEAGGDHRDLHRIAHRFVLDHAEVDLHVVALGGLANDRAGFVDFVQAQAGSSR